MSREKGLPPKRTGSPASRDQPEQSWSDARLVQKCLDGSEEAWHCLVDRYKRLIYSVPIRSGFSQDQATDIFQDVCLELLNWLPKLREPRALPAWLLQVTTHKCFHLKRKGERFVAGENLEDVLGRMPADGDGQEALIWHVEQEQILREALRALEPRCRQLIEMLFSEAPPVPYKTVAAKLEMPTGSIGFMRRNCLQKMKKLLERRGVWRAPK